MAAPQNHRILEKYQNYKMERKLKEGYSGGEELRRAMAALAGPNASKNGREETGDEIGPRTWPLPAGLAENKDPQVRELAFAAQKYGAAGIKDPGDFEAIYNHGLALQELALRCSGSRESQEHLLRQAADRYEAAWKLRQKSHAALYNWGVALSDMARVIKSVNRDQAHQFLRLAAEKYSMSLQWNPQNPQALNNWGLVLQELANLQSPAEQADLVKHSIVRFRQAIRVRPDFDRACYNLGTVFYAFACSQQSSVTQRLPSRVTQDPEHAASEREGEATAQQLFGLAAQYILIAHALQPSKDVYKKSLHVTKPLLPLPFLRSGSLTTLRPQDPSLSTESWTAQAYVLDSESLRPADDNSKDDEPSTSSSLPHISLVDITSVVRCLDPSLPVGHAFWVGLVSQPTGLYFVAGTKAEAEGWVDGLLLCAHIASMKQLPALRQALKQPVSDQELDQSRKDTPIDT